MSMRPDKPPVRGECGFTLVEAIVVIVITGILAAAVAVFLRVPVQGYLDVARRAELTDIADTALRRMVRDLRQALPNSIRVTGTTQIEFIPIKSAGRYRADGPGNVLDFAAAADTFDVIGPGVDIVANDFIVIFNLGIAPADAYQTVANINRRPVTTTGTGLTTVGFNGGAFPFASPAKRFHVVGTPVSYIFAGGLLTRYWNYAYGALPTTGTSAVLASNVSSCTFSYAAGVTALNGLVSMQLQITKSGESVNLVHEVHVSNVP